jgi:hypothetical protein
VLNASPSQDERTAALYAALATIELKFSKLPPSKAVAFEGSASTTSGESCLARDNALLQNPLTTWHFPNNGNLGMAW